MSVCYLFEKPTPAAEFVPDALLGIKLVSVG
jgi:hypothetical protein